ALGQELKAHLQNEPSNFSRKYPALARHLAELKSDRWEVMSSETATLDYGTAEFKGRSLEAAFGTSRVRFRNAILGEYKDLCLMTGYINDTEFGIQREPIGILCEGIPRELPGYKTAEKFTSRW